MNATHIPDLPDSRKGKGFDYESVTISERIMCIKGENPMISYNLVSFSKMKMRTTL